MQQLSGTNESIESTTVVPTQHSTEKCSSNMTLSMILLQTGCHEEDAGCETPQMLPVKMWQCVTPGRTVS